jgi:hypothetical protein
MIHRTRNTGLTVASALSLSVVVASAQAQSFVIGSGETAGQQVLSDPAGTGIVKSNGKVSTAIDQEAGVLMLNDNQSVKIESGGTVETEGNESDGIASEGSNASIVSDGSIITTGDQLAGIFSLGPGASIRNSGTISSLGQNAPYGISATGVGAVVENAGLIETGGGTVAASVPIGVLVTGSGSVVRNTGAIRTQGTAGYGILSDGDRTVIENRGRITSSGPLSYGVLSAGENATITNFGRIEADLGETEFALFMEGDGVTLDLRAGTAIQGNIAFFGADGTLEIGRGLNTALTFADMPDYLDTKGAPFAINGNILAVVDPTGFSAQDDMLADTTGAISDALGSRLAAARSMTRGDAANANGQLINPVADVVQDDGLALWGSVLGGYRDQEAEGAGSDFESWFGGAVIGIDGLAGSGTRLGLLAGAITGELETETNSQSIDTDNYFAGAYASFQMGYSFFDLSAIGGFATFDSSRRVANNLVLGGIEHAIADYDGAFVSPAAEIGTTFAIGGGDLITSLRARYAGLFLDDYRESGSAANWEVDDRRVDVVELRGQLAYALAAVETGGGTLEMTVRTGVDGTFGDGGSVDAILLGQSLFFDSDSDEAVAEGFAGLQMIYTDTSGLQLDFGAELGLDTNASFTANGRLGVIVPF